MCYNKETQTETNMRKEPKYAYYKRKYLLHKCLCDSYLGIIDMQHVIQAQRDEIIMQLQEEIIMLRKQLDGGA